MNLFLPYAETLETLVFATEHQIAVLGLDAFEIRQNSLLTVALVDLSNHITFAGDWKLM